MFQRRLSTTLQDKLANNVHDGGFNLIYLSLIIWTRSHQHRDPQVYLESLSRSHSSWRKSGGFIDFLSRISLYNKHPSRHASAHIRDSFNNESKQMHFLAWTFHWRPWRQSRDIEMISSDRIWNSENAGWSINIYIAQKKKSEKRAEKLVFQSIRVKARNSGDSRRNRDEGEGGGGGHRSTMPQGDRELFLYKRDDNQARWTDRDASRGNNN